MKNKNIAGVLALFLGGLGAHKFYLGKTGVGILYLCLCWTYIPAIISLIEAIRFFTSSEADFNAKYNQNNQRPISYVQPIEYAEEVEEETHQLEAHQGEMKMCPNCGAANSKENNFCESCGYKLV